MSDGAEQPGAARYLSGAEAGYELDSIPYSTTEAGNPEG